MQSNITIGDTLSLMALMNDISFGGWQHCKELSNGALRLIITAEVGPRIIFCSLEGHPNLFAEIRNDMGKVGGDTFRLYGGHRLWHAPEVYPRTYVPDNSPPAFFEDNGAVVVKPPEETHLGIQKEVRLTLDPTAPLVKIIHTLSNTGSWDITLAPWALSVMTTGGTAVVPLPPKGSHPDALLPNGNLTLWPYTNLADERWTLGKEYVLLKQRMGSVKPQKLGLYVPHGWAAYTAHDLAFIKFFEVHETATYPDNNSTVEVFTNHEMLELESLGPLTQLSPGESVTHTEYWYVAEQVTQPTSDQEVTDYLLPHVEEVREMLEF
jgi:hypothetical protein